MVGASMFILRGIDQVEEVAEQGTEQVELRRLLPRPGGLSARGAVEDNEHVAPPPPHPQL